MDTTREPVRKRVIDAKGRSTATWLAVERLAQVELTSEDPASPIESALTGAGGGWRASGPGEQLIRLVFDRPQALSLIHLVFEERHEARVHEFSLRWSPDGGDTWHPIVRQQYSFSPAGAVREVEDYAVAHANVTQLELQIVPDISGGPAVASLKELRLR